MGPVSERARGEASLPLRAVHTRDRNAATNVRAYAINQSAHRCNIMYALIKEKTHAPICVMRFAFAREAAARSKS